MSWRFPLTESEISVDDKGEVKTMVLCPFSEVFLEGIPIDGIN